jgi:cytochrome P450
VQRRRRSGTDVISRLIASRRDGDRLEFAELVANGVFFIANAFHNTVNLIANALHVLLAYPSELELLANEPARIPGALLELARFDSPVQVIGRYTRAEYEVGGVHIPPGEALAAHVGAAHRDPEAYAEPERLDLRRERACPILTFGHGSHACLGARLALMEAEVGLRTLLVHCPRLELSEAPERTRGFALRGLQRLSVRSR